MDFSAIANEKITLVHVGEKLIILFDNHSTVTLEPFFDSRHDTINNLTIEVAPGPDLTVTEFASTFPITTDASVLPAAGVEKLPYAAVPCGRSRSRQPACARG